MTPSLARSFLLPMLALLSGCHFRFSHEGIEVDGVRLTEHHTETLSVPAWPSTGLVIEAHRGDVDIVRHEGPTEIEVQVYEREPGQAHAALVEGRLVLNAGGQPCAIGRVTVRTGGSAADLSVTTGHGDVTVRGVVLAGSASLSTGMGAVEVREAGSPTALVLSTGMGDILVRHVSATDLRATSGMGDVVAEDLEGPRGEFSTGMGDIEIRRCTLTQVRAETGMGDVVARDSAIDQREFSSGLGSVSVR